MARDVTRQQLARRGLIAIVAVALIGVLITLRSNGTFGSQPHVTAHVADAGGAMRTGADVKLNGVLVGEVAAITRGSHGGVDVDLNMSKDDLEEIPSNVVARILPATVFGTTFVDLVVHGDASKDHLEAGDTVEADTTQGTLELQQALDDIDRLVKALGPSELASAIGSAAQALDGRGAQIANTVRTANDFLGRLNPKMPQIRTDLDELATATTVLNDVAPDLLDATDKALVTLHTIATQSSALTSLLSGGTNLAITARKFLDDNKAHLVRFINNSSELLDAVYANRRAGITDAITVNLALGQELPTVVKDGYVQTDGTLSAHSWPYYGSGQRPSYRATSSSMSGLYGGVR